MVARMRASSPDILKAAAPGTERAPAADARLHHREEAVASSELPLISAVFWNRLKRDMPLQADPTVQYAVGKGRQALTRADLQVDHPFNTYRRHGLPPGPIANPGCRPYRRRPARRAPTTSTSSRWTSGSTRSRPTWRITTRRWRATASLARGRPPALSPPGGSDRRGGYRTPLDAASCYPSPRVGRGLLDPVRVAAGTARRRAVCPWRRSRRSTGCSGAWRGWSCGGCSICGSRASSTCPQAGPFILAANHHNYLDGVVLGVAVPRPIAFLVMPRVFRATPLHPPFHRRIGSIPVTLERPDPGAIKRVLHALEDGRVVGIFPEGPFSREGRLVRGPARDGACSRSAPACRSCPPRSTAPTRPCAAGASTCRAARPLAVRFGAADRTSAGAPRPDRADGARRGHPRIMSEIAALLACRPPPPRPPARGRLVTAVGTPPGKAWGGRFTEGADPTAEAFTASLSFDRRLWPHDITGSAAWARALARAKLITDGGAREPDRRGSRRSGGARGRHASRSAASSRTST